VSRFFAEAQAVNQIAHENIIEVTDFVEGGDAQAYYIMELLRGSTLSDVLSAELALAPSRAVAIGVQVCNAMAAVHDAGIVHRDLKPENIFLVERGGRRDFVKILDFGVAKLAEAEATGVRRTAAGTMLGTPQYMAPEQAAGQETDHRADIYTLGVILYELLTGRCPFEAKTIGEVIVKHLSMTPRPPSRVKDLPHPLPAALEAVVLRCLEKLPARRYQKMAEVEAALRAVAAEQHWQLESFGSMELPVHRSRRRGRLPLLAGAAALLLVGAGLTAWLVVGGTSDGDGASGKARRPHAAARDADERASHGAPPASPASSSAASAAPSSAAAPASAESAAAEPDALSAEGAPEKGAKGKTGKRAKQCGAEESKDGSKPAPADKGALKKEDRSGTLDPFK
jgi:serine/threonine-protein kinase